MRDALRTPQLITLPARSLAKTHLLADAAQRGAAPYPIHFGIRSVGIVFGISGTFFSYSQLYVKNVPSTRLV